MRYDDKIKYPETVDTYENIIRQLSLHCPEYELPGAVVTAELVNAVWAAMDDMSEPDETGCYVLDEEEVKSVLDCLPMELKVRPMSKETISAIMDLIFRAAKDRYLEDELFGECEDADAYGFRAAAKEKLGFYEEALQDYSIAYAMEPQDHWLLIDKAQIYIKLGQITEALKNSKLCFGMSKDICIEDFSRLQDILMLVFMFDSCGDARMTVHAMLRFTECLNELIPYISLERDGEIRIEKGNDEFSTGLITIEAFLTFIKEIDEKPERDIGTDMLLERLKNQIAIFRTKLGI